VLTHNTDYECLLISTHHDDRAVYCSFQGTHLHNHNRALIEQLHAENNVNAIKASSVAMDDKRVIGELSARCQTADTENIRLHIRMAELTQVRRLRCDGGYIRKDGWG